jgi:hypothetical protein
MSAPAVARIYLTDAEMQVTDTLVMDDGAHLPIVELTVTPAGVAVTFDGWGGGGITFTPGDAMDALPRPNESEAVRAIRTAVGLIAKYGLCRDSYEDEAGCLCPAGAIAVAVDLPADVWESPHRTVLDSNNWQSGFDAMYALVSSLKRWKMPPAKEWTGEDLANHLAWWLADVKPSAEQVLHQMRVAAAGLAEQSSPQGSGESRG